MARQQFLSIRARDVVAKLHETFPDVHKSVLYFVTFQATIAVVLGNRDAGPSLNTVADNALHVTYLLAEEVGVDQETLSKIYECADAVMLEMLQGQIPMDRQAPSAMNVKES